MHQFLKFIYFGITLYMFWTVLLSIIMSSRLYIEQQVYVKWIQLPTCQQAGRSICMTYTCCCMYSLELLMMDGRTIQNMQSKVKGKAVPLQAWSGPEGSRKLRFPDFMTTAQGGVKVVSLMHWPHLPPGNSPGTHLRQRLSRPQGHSVIGRIMSMKNSNDTIWNRTSDLPICSTAKTCRVLFQNK